MFLKFNNTIVNTDHVIKFQMKEHSALEITLTGEADNLRFSGGEAEAAWRVLTANCKNVRPSSEYAAGSYRPKFTPT